jgi:hypothetical protein
MKKIENELKPLLAQYEREKGRVVEIADMKKKIEQVKSELRLLLFWILLKTYCGV